MLAGPFLDSNILIYAYGDDPKTKRAQTICSQPHVISVQSLNEFASVTHRKMRYDWDRIKPCLLSILDLAEQVMPLTVETNKKAIALAERYKLQVYDGMILAAALEAGCDTLLSEDMQHGMNIEDLLTIRNPFA
jgi:predicted nucleic acid-binding protein